MKPIILRQHEIVHLRDHGSVIAWRVVKLVNTLPEGGGLLAIQKPGTRTCLPLIDGQFQWSPYGGAPYEPYPDVSEYCPYGRTGEERWVRETWNVVPVGRPAPLCGTAGIPESLPDGWGVMYQASGDLCTKLVGWRPSIHMPRWASRFTVTLDVGVKRIQEVTEEEVSASGVEVFREYCQSGCQDFDESMTDIRLFKVLTEWKNRGMDWDRNDYFWKINCTLK